MAKKVSEAPVWPTIAVKNMERSQKFYEDVLGYEVLMKTEHDVAYRGPGDTGVSLYESSDNAGTNKATYCSWKVEDLESVMDDLRGKGVEFEEFDMENGPKTVDGIATQEADGKTMKASWFKDPDGNILCLMEMPS